MKYQPPVMNELSPEQQRLFHALQAEEKAQLALLSTNHESRQRAEAYHTATSSLLEERAKGESELLFVSPVTEQEIDEAFKKYEEESLRASNIESTTFLLNAGLLLPKRKFVGPKQFSKRPIPNKTRVHDAVHAVVAKRISKKLTKG